MKNNSPNSSRRLSRNDARVNDTHYAHFGYSIVELMVAITIGLIILVAVAQLFTTSRSTYTVQEGLARVQEGGRFGMEFLATDIRMAGYMGCNSNLPASNVSNIAQPATDAYQLLSGGIRGYRYIGPGTARTAWQPDLPDDFFNDGDVVAGTDVVLIQRASTLDTNLTGNMGTVNANIQILATATISSDIQADDILLISDCGQADIFRANNVSSGSGTVTITHSSSVNSSNNLSKAYDTKAQIMKLVSRAYFIGLGTTSGEPALMRMDLVRPGATPPIARQELIEGVENMRISYGLDTDATSDFIVNRYMLADDALITDWGKVLNVRLGILLRTGTDTGIPDTLTYDLPGATLGPFNDLRRRHLFTMTIQLRNAGI